jgi:hypothetical protein
MGLQEVRVVMNVDDRILDTGCNDTIEYVIDKGAALQLHERLWQRIGERAHSRAQPRRKDHRRVYFGGHQYSVLESYVADACGKVAIVPDAERRQLGMRKAAG